MTLSYPGVVSVHLEEVTADITKLQAVLKEAR